SVSTQAAQIFGILWLEQSAGGWNRYNRQFSIQPRGQFQIHNVAPGKYRACAVENPVAMQMLMENAELQKKISSRCEAVDVEEGGHATLQLTAISHDDFEKMLSELDDQ